MTNIIFLSPHLGQFAVNKLSRALMHNIFTYGFSRRKKELGKDIKYRESVLLVLFHRDDVLRFVNGSGASLDELG